MTPSHRPANEPSSAATRFGLDPLFYPRSIVLLDALGQSGSVADSTLKSISASYLGGPVRRIEVPVGLPSVLDEIPEATDLAVIVAPPDRQTELVLACDRRNVRTALLLTANHREPGLSDLHDSLKNISDKCVNGLRIIGPQSFGLINPNHDLDITAGQPMPRPGNIAFISQSGALCSAVLDWSLRTGVGFSTMVSCGVPADIDWPDLITYFGDDPYTKSIVIYVETINDARAFLSACREVAFSKPIIALKAGRTAVGAAVAASHSHGDGGADAVLNAALQRVGVLRVRSIAELFYMASILSTQPLPRGPNLTVITNAIGPAILATDTLLASGGELAEISAETKQELEPLLPNESCCDNPIDLMGDATADRYEEAVRILSGEKESNGILVILTPQEHTSPTATARKIVSSTRRIGKPVLASWMGGDRVAEGQNILFEAGIPTFPYPDTPARLFALMWRQSQNLDMIYETPSVIVDEEQKPVDSASASVILEGARSAGLAELSEWEAKAILRAYGIPVVDVMQAATEDEAVTCAGLFGYPALLKLLSPSRNLADRVKGVRVGLRNEDDVRKAFRSIRESVAEHDPGEEFHGVTVQRMVSTRGIELVAGCRIDDRFGPYMYFGTGGKMSNILRDHALGLPPLTTALAQRMIERTRVWKALGQLTEQEKNRLCELQGMLVRLSQLIVQQPVIKELEINPILATESNLVALDARISIHPDITPLDQLPKPAIRPYPVQYTWEEKTRSGQPLLIRPIRPEDEPLIVDFHKKLSEETIYRRYFFQHKLTRRTSHERLRRTCFLDFDREIALGAFIEDPVQGRAVTAVGRLSRNRTGDSAELAIVVADPYQSLGIGTTLMKHLMDVARAEKISLVEGTMLPGNIHMQHLFNKLGFTIEPADDDGVRAWLEL